MTEARAPLIEQSLSETRVEGRVEGNCLMIEISGRLHDSGFGTLRELVLETMARQSCDLTLLDLSQAQNTCSLLLQTMVRADPASARRLTAGDGSSTS